MLDKCHTEESTHIYIPGVHVPWLNKLYGDSVLCNSFLSFLQLVDLKPRKKGNTYRVSQKK